MKTLSILFLMIFATTLFTGCASNESSTQSSSSPTVSGYMSVGGGGQIH